MAIQICTVSGVLRDTSGTGINGVSIRAVCNRPFIHPTDGSMILNYLVSTSTDVTGAWSLDLVETETPEVSLTVSFQYPLATGYQDDIKEYAIIVPNQASANFTDLITSTDNTQV